MARALGIATWKASRRSDCGASRRNSGSRRWPSTATFAMQDPHNAMTEGRLEGIDATVGSAVMSWTDRMRCTSTITRSRSTRVRLRFCSASTTTPKVPGLLEGVEDLLPSCSMRSWATRGGRSDPHDFDPSRGYLLHLQQARPRTPRRPTTPTRSTCCDGASRSPSCACPATSSNLIESALNGRVC